MTSVHCLATPTAPLPIVVAEAGGEEQPAWLDAPDGGDRGFGCAGRYEKRKGTVSAVVDEVGRDLERTKLQGSVGHEKTCWSRGFALVKKLAALRIRVITSEA